VFFEELGLTVGVGEEAVVRSRNIEVDPGFRTRG